MRIAVIGAGGIGLYLTKRLLDAGHDVFLRVRQSALADWESAQLRVERESAPPEAVAVARVFSDPADPALAGSIDLAIIATKAWQVREVAAELPGLLAPNGRVLTTQNGVDAPTVVADFLPADLVLGGAMVVIAERIGRATVRLIGAEATLRLGAPNGREANPADARVLAALAGAGIETSWTRHLGATLWQKLALVASYGGVGALSGATVGETREHPATRNLVERAMAEVFAIARADGAALGPRELAEIRDTYLHGFSPGTTASLQRDLAAGRPSELDDQSGAIVRHAERLGLDAPIHRTIAASQSLRERAARGQL